MDVEAMTRRIHGLVLGATTLLVGGAAFAQGTPGIAGTSGVPGAMPVPSVAPVSTVLPTRALLPGVPLVPAPVRGALASRVRVGKRPADLPALRQRFVARQGGGVAYRLADGTVRDLIPYASLQTTRALVATTTPASVTRFQGYVDGRNDQAVPPAQASLKARQTPVKDQQQRGTCVAFAVAGAIEAAYQKSPALDLSEEDIYFVTQRAVDRHSCTNGTWVHSALSSLAEQKTSLETDWPYAGNALQLGCRSDPTLPLPNIERPAASRANARYGPYPGRFAVVGRNDGLASDAGAFVNNPRQLEAWIAAGYEVILSVGVAGDLGITVPADVALDADGAPLGSVGGHAMLLVGYDRANGGTFELKNSWGPRSGSSGYVRLTYDYVRTYGWGAAVIYDVFPVQNAPTLGAQLPVVTNLPTAVGPVATPVLPGSARLPQSFLLANELSAGRPADASWKLSDPCTFENATANTGGTTFWKGSAPLRELEVRSYNGQSYFYCLSDRDCVDVSPLPGVNYAGLSAPQRRRLDFPSAWQSKADKVRELVRLCKTAP